MKQPPKPFAIEIKRSRRPPSAGPAELFGKESAALNGSGAALFSRRADLIHQGQAQAGAAELSVPAFLQTAPHRSVELSREAAQLFAPRPAAASEPAPGAEIRPQPRILPSLAPPQDAAFEAQAKAPRRPGPDPEVKAARQPRRSEADRAGKAKASAKRRAHDAAPAEATEPRAERGPAAARGLAPESPPPAQNPAEANGARPSAAARGARSRVFSRRGREDAAALPPGQHWKRRLTPRAW